MAKVKAFTRIRQMLMFYLLLMVAGSAWLSYKRTTDWNDSLWVAVYPINGDQSAASKNYINDLLDEDFVDVEEFFTKQISLYGIDLEEPVQMNLMQEVKELPPPPPPPGKTLSIMSWSLKMRHWAWRMEREQNAVRADIKMFVIYFDPEQHDRLGHSVGLQKGLFGIVNAFASNRQRGSNHVILAHELMHTVGATDKYDFQTNLPVFPEGYAEPENQPRYPQQKAEIMGGRIPISESEARIPKSLKSVIVGKKTAEEIKWLANTR